ERQGDSGASFGDRYGTQRSGRGRPPYSLRLSRHRNRCRACLFRAWARRSLEQLGIEVRLDACVMDCDCSGVSFGNDVCRRDVWAAGVKASLVAEWLGAESDRAGRVKVKADLSVPAHPGIFVIGDAAAATGPDGKPLPGVAPVAKQQGWYVANSLTARAEGRTLLHFVIASPRSVANARSRRSERSSLRGSCHTA